MASAFTAPSWEGGLPVARSRSKARRTSPRRTLLILLFAAVIFTPFGTVDGKVGHVHELNPASTVHSLSTSPNGSLTGRIAAHFARTRDLGRGMATDETASYTRMGVMTLAEAGDQIDRHFAWVAAEEAAEQAARLCGGDPVVIPPTSDARGGSAGLARALASADVLTDGAISSGRTIAATGVFDPYGEVAWVGGLPAKLHAAASIGADLVLVPNDNLATATPIASELGLTVWGVSTVAEALDRLAPGACTSG